MAEGLQLFSRIRRRALVASGAAHDDAVVALAIAARRAPGGGTPTGG